MDLHGGRVRLAQQVQQVRQAQQIRQVRQVTRLGKRGNCGRGGGGGGGTTNWHDQLASRSASCENTYDKSNSPFPS